MELSFSNDQVIRNDQVIKDAREFARLIVYLGYSVFEHSEDTWYIFTKGLNIVVRDNFFLNRTPKTIIDELDQHMGQRHMMCKECHTVLLQNSRDCVL